MTTAVLSYSVKFIREISRHARLQEKFSSFYLEHTTRSKIIACGIRSQPRPYRRSRRGKDHFQQIHTICTTSGKTKLPVIRQGTINHGMLQSLPIQESVQYYNRTGYKTTVPWSIVSQPSTKHKPYNWK